jgi:hypothetical protein
MRQLLVIALLAAIASLAPAADRTLEEVPHGKPIKTDGEKAFLWDLTKLILHADDFDKIDTFANNDVVISAWKRKDDDKHLFFTFLNRNQKRMRVKYTVSDGKDRLGEYELIVPRENQDWHSHVVFMDHKPFDRMTVELRASEVGEKTADP